MDSITVLLADDHRMIRSGIRDFLELAPDLTVVGEASDGVEALALARSLKPDVILLDIGMPLKTGIDVTRELRAEGNTVGILIVSAYDDQPFVVQALRAGANGYILKTADDTELINAVRSVHEGRIVLDDRLMAGMVGTVAQVSDKTGAREALSARELEVLELIAQAKTNKAIGTELGISDRTVQGHIANIFAKLGAQSRTDAVMIGLRLGLIAAH